MVSFLKLSSMRLFRDPINSNNSTLPYYLYQAKTILHHKEWYFYVCLGNRSEVGVQQQRIWWWYLEDDAFLLHSNKLWNQTVKIYWQDAHFLICI